jgi:hypothetical protein
VRVRSFKAGKSENFDEVMHLPIDPANGLLFTLPKGLLSGPSATVSYVAFSPKPWIVNIVYSQEGSDQLATQTESHKATRFIMEVKIGGISGVVASLTKKKPVDTHMCVAANGHPGQVGYSLSPPQEVRDEESSLRLRR